MTKTTLFTADAPRPIGPYSQAIKHENLIFCSGQISLDPQTMALIGDDARSQAVQVFRNIQAVAAAANLDLSAVIKLTIYLVDLNDFAAVNEVMQEFFVEPYPTRTTIQVTALPKNAKLEIEALLAALED